MRETKVVVIDDDGRDKGKRFIIREMPALQAEKFAYRLIVALAKAGADVEVMKGTGMAGLAMAGLQALPQLDFADAEPLMDEMMQCVSVEPSPGVKRPLMMESPDGDGDDIQEIKTLLRLRSEIMELHTRFFGKAGPSNSISETTTSPASSSIPTSPAPSAR